MTYDIVMLIQKTYKPKRKSYHWKKKKMFASPRLFHTSTSSILKIIFACLVIGTHFSSCWKQIIRVFNLLSTNTMFCYDFFTEQCIMLSHNEFKLELHLKNNWVKLNLLLSFYLVLTYYSLVWFLVLQIRSSSFSTVFWSEPIRVFF